jgi:hypothetical protein
MQSPAPQLEFEMTYRVKTTHPLDLTRSAPYGAKQYWQVSEATLAGERIRAKLAAPGMDWMLVHDDGFWRPDVRAAFITDDEAVILLHYTGLVQQTEKFKQAAEANRPTGWEDQYMRLAMRFDASAERYRWLNQSLFIATGRLEGTGSIEYAVFRLC